MNGADEVWAYGLRNPWRIAFDKNGDLYIGDVGQNAREEIDFQPAGSKGGKNYGWDLAEGTLGNPPPGSVLPIFEYGRDLGTVVTGGEVYRGDRPALVGAYFFADFGSGRIWTIRNGEATERTSQIVGPDTPLEFISSFGHDGKGNLYAVSLSGEIFRLLPRKEADDLGDVLKGGAAPTGCSAAQATTISSAVEATTGSREASATTCFTAARAKTDFGATTAQILSSSIPRQGRRTSTRLPVSRRART